MKSVAHPSQHHQVVVKARARDSNSRLLNTVFAGVHVTQNSQVHITQEVQGPRRERERERARARAEREILQVRERREGGGGRGGGGGSFIRKHNGVFQGAARRQALLTLCGRSPRFQPSLAAPGTIRKAGVVMK